LNVAEMDRRVRELGRRARLAGEVRSAPEVVVRRVAPALLRRAAAVRCVRCGGVIDDAGPGERFHDGCRPAPAPPPADVSAAPVRRRRCGPRRSKLTATERTRVLEWLTISGPATARWCAWALGVSHREVQLFLHSIDGDLVEAAGKLVTGQRGAPPTLWRVAAEPDTGPMTR
jgi:hypothetical protein